MSKAYDVDVAIAAMVRLACAEQEVVALQDDGDRPRRIDPRGTVWLRDGELSDPEIDLSPPSYNYVHRVPVEIAAYISSEPLRVVLDRIAGKIGTAVFADRTLGGLITYLDVTALGLININQPGGQTQKGGMFDIVATYHTSNPLI